MSAHMSRTTAAAHHHTLANASKPRLCPSTTSILWFFANLLLPSITKATCCGTGPCRIAAIRSSLTFERAHSAGGDWKSHFRRCEVCRGEVILYVVQLVAMGPN
jgi:hypothetical protein